MRDIRQAFKRSIDEIWEEDEILRGEVKRVGRAKGRGRGRWKMWFLNFQ